MIPLGFYLPEDVVRFGLNQSSTIEAFHRYRGRKSKYWNRMGILLEQNYAYHTLIHTPTPNPSEQNRIVKLLQRDRGKIIQTLHMEGKRFVELNHAFTPFVNNNETETNMTANKSPQTPEMKNSSSLRPVNNGITRPAENQATAALVKNSDIVTLCPTDSFIAAQYTKKENALSRQQNEELGYSSHPLLLLLY